MTSRPKIVLVKAPIEPSGYVDRDRSVIVRITEPERLIDALVSPFAKIVAARNARAKNWWFESYYVTKGGEVIYYDL